MDRRSFIRVASGSGTFLLASTHLGGCTDTTGIALEPWSGPSPLLDGEDIRLRIVSYGLLAPSFRNTQPWWVDVSGEGIVVRPESHRIPTLFDPTGRQTRISLGAFIETLSIAASAFHTRLDVRIFPEGSAETRLSNDLIIAGCTLTADAAMETDQLFRMITRRRTNRTTYFDKPLESRHITNLQVTSMPDHVSLALVTDPGDVETLSGIVRTAAMEEARDASLRPTAADHLRLTDAHVQSQRDGMTLENAGFPLSERIWVQLRSAALGEDREVLLDQLSGLITDQTNSAAAYGMLLTQEDTPENHVAAGRTLLRVYLRAGSSGVALQPFSRAVETEASRADLSGFAARKDWYVQSVFRLGYGAPVPPSPRRSLFEIVRI